MKINKNISFKKILITTVWILLGMGTLTLLVSAYVKNQSKCCCGLYIQINGVNNHFFIDKKDIRDIIYKYAGHDIVGKPIHTFDLQRMEKELEKDVWLQDALLYFDNKGNLIADIEEREPVARVFTMDGNTFYIDQTIKIMPLSNKHTAKLPVFTGFTGNMNKPVKNDSLLLGNVKELSLCIQKDSFLMAMIDQVDITSKNQFELIPKIGNQIFIFGDTFNMQSKFEKFKLFYEKVVPVAGWNKYSKINLTYKDQVVAVIKDAADVRADSLRSVEIMKALAEYSAKMAEDTTKTFAQDNAANTTDISLILQSLQRDEHTEEQADSVMTKTMVVEKKQQTTASQKQKQTVPKKQ